MSPDHLTTHSRYFVLAVRRRYVMLCLFLIQRLINGYLASGLTIHMWRNEKMLRRLTEWRVPPQSAVTPLHCPFATRLFRQAKAMARRPPSSRRFGRLLQHYQALCPLCSRNRARCKDSVHVRACAWRVYGGALGAGASGAPVAPVLVCCYDRSTP